jgi:hypothetical protein
VPLQQGRADVTPVDDHGVAIYQHRMRLAVWRSYALQVAACAFGALIAGCAARCAIDGHYDWLAICTSVLVLNFVTFNYAARDRARARKTLEMLMQ